MTPRRAHGVALTALVLTAALSVAGPPGDYGDAPVGSTSQNILAYPGVPARWTTLYQHTNMVTSPVQHNHGTWLNPGATFFLGDVPPTVKTDSLLDPLSPENDAFPRIVVDNLGPIPRAELHVRVATTAAHAGARFYLNVFIDNSTPRDGQFKDGYQVGTPLAAWVPEWQVADYPIDIQQPGQAVDLILTPIALADPLAPVWVRTIVSDAPIGTILKAGAAFWDTTMPQVHGYRGEVEDAFLGYNPNPPPAGRSTGVWLRRVFYSGQRGMRKPACDVNYRGPREITLNACPANTPIPFDFQVTDLLGGCTGADALVGIYGIKPIVNGPGPNVVFVPAGVPAGSNFPGGPNTLTCASGLQLVLPAAIDGFGLLWNGTIPALSLDPTLSVLEGCYADPPKIGRRWRVFVRTQTCGSDHRVFNLAPHPRRPQNTLAAATVAPSGGAADHVDLLYPGSVERFEEPPLVAFPNPEFTNFRLVLNSPPFSFAALDNSRFSSAPSAMRLIDARYQVDPGSDPFWRTSTVLFRYFGEITLATLTSTSGETLTGTPPIAPGLWQTFAFTLPPGFDLQTIDIDGGDGWIDDVELVQVRRERPPENDRWQEAIPMGVGEDRASTMDASNDGASPCDPPGLPRDVWFSFVPDQPLATIDTEGSAVPAAVSVHALGDDGPGPSLACNGAPTDGGSPRVVVPVVPGQTYLIRAATAAPGEVVVHLDLPTPAPGGGCAAAASVAEGVYPFNTAIVPGDGLGPIECFNPGSLPFDGIWWYRYSASCTGEARLDTCLADVTPTAIEVFPGSGPCPADGQAPVRCNTGACGSQAAVAFPTIAGHSYYVRVSGQADPARRGRGVLGIACRATCRADFNGSGAASVQDIFDFLAAYFSGDPRADFNLSGSISVQDIFDFLAVYFGGC